MSTSFAVALIAAAAVGLAVLGTIAFFEVRRSTRKSDLKRIEAATAFGIARFADLSGGAAMITEAGLKKAKAEKPWTDADRQNIETLQSYFSEIGHVISSEKKDTVILTPMGSGLMPVMGKVTVNAYGMTEAELQAYPAKMRALWKMTER